MPYTLPKPFLSHSQVSTYEACPRKYEYHYIKHFPEPPVVAFKFGTCTHEALELNFAQKVQSREDLPTEAVLGHFMDGWGRHKSLPFDAGDGWDISLSKGVAILQTYMSFHAPAVQPLWVEQRVEVDVGEGLQYLGVVDILTEDHVLIDFKTAKRPWTAERARESTQLTGYALLVYTRLGELPANTRIHCLVKDGSVKDLDAGVRTQEDVTRYCESLHACARDISAGKFPRRTKADGHQWCSQQWCPFYTDCMKGTHT